MFARSDEITEPCGLPVFVFDHSPSSITPALSHFWISRRMRGSATRCSTNWISQLLSRLSKKSSDIGIQNVVHLLLQERVRQRIQCLMLAAPRAKPVRKAEKILFIDLVEDGYHGLLDKFVFDSRDREWTLPSTCFLYVHSSRGRRSIGSAMNSAMKIGQPIL